MKIEAGKCYRTRDGHKATIYRTDADLWSFPGPMKVDGGINVYVRASTARQLERELAAVNAEVTRMKETLSDILPALERASGCSAKDLARPGNALTADEVAALWMARAIMEGEL